MLGLAALVGEWSGIYEVVGASLRRVDSSDASAALPEVASLNDVLALTR